MSAKPNWAEAVWQRLTRRRALVILVLTSALALFLAWLPPSARSALAHNLLTDRTLVVLLLVFSLLALSLLWSAGQRLDAWIFLSFNILGHHSPWLDRGMWLATQIGNMGTAMAGAAVMFFLGYRRLSVEMVLGLLTLWLAVELVKALTDRARPFILLTNARVIGWREPGLSFPSGHTAQTFFLMSLFVSHFQPGFWGAAVLYLVAVLVGFTRVYVGVHYPRDVLAGAILGLVWALLILLVSAHMQPPPMPLS